MQFTIFKFLGPMRENTPVEFCLTYNLHMALRDFKELQQDADALTPKEQVELAHYLLAKARGAALKQSGNLNEYKGTVKLSIDPLNYQKSIRAEWS